MSPLTRALSNRKKAVSATATIMLIILMLTNPPVPPHRETVTALEPVTVYALWGWRASGWTSGRNPESGWVELDLPPMSPFIAPINWKVGNLEGTVLADLNVTGFAQDLVDGAGYYPLAAVPFSEGREFVLKPFLNHTAETITTEVRVWLTAEVMAATYNDTSIQRLETGYLTILLDGVALAQGQFHIWGACGSMGPPWCSQVGADVFYDGVKDMTNSTLTFLWNGSVPVHILPGAVYYFSAKSTDYVDHLQVTESCVVERHLLNYLGIGKPKLSDCNVVSYYPLPPITFDVQMCAKVLS
jgi:hypothetical protein